MQHDELSSLIAQLEYAMEKLMQLREQSPDENLKYAEDSLDDAITSLNRIDN